MTGEGYRYGAVVVDAALFVPQSRERVFIIAVADDVHIPAELLTDKPRLGQLTPFHPSPVVALLDPLPDPRFDLPRMSTALAPLWWRLLVPPRRNTIFADFIEDEPTGVRWHTLAQTERLMAMMTPGNQAKVEVAKRTGKRMVGSLYRRIRHERDGTKVQRAEVRFDDVAGCLRMPTGGSSRQTVMIIEGASVRSRLLSPREAARLMGLPDHYQLPTNANTAGLREDTWRHRGARDPRSPCVAGEAERRLASAATAKRHVHARSSPGRPKPGCLPGSGITTVRRVLCSGYTC